MVSDRTRLLWHRGNSEPRSLDSRIDDGELVTTDPTIIALAAYITNGLVTQTAADTFTGRTIVGPAAGINVTNGSGVAGNPTLGLANDLSAVEGLSGSGLAVRTATDTWATRTLTAPAAGITVSNGDGVAGNPTLALANDLAALEALSGTDTIYYRSGVSTWSAVTIGANLTFSGGTLSGSGSGGTSYIPMVDGSIPAAFIQNPDGSLVLTPYP
jgi:hypothetical protein